MMMMVMGIFEKKKFVEFIRYRGGVGPVGNDRDLGPTHSSKNIKKKNFFFTISAFCF